MRNFALVFVAIMAFSFLNSALANPPAPKPTIEKIGTCTAEASLKDGLQCCVASTGREDQCRRVVRAFFTEKTRREGIAKLDDIQYSPSPIELCVASSDEKSAVQCCTELKSSSDKRDCLERVTADVEIGKVTADVDGSASKRQLEELDSRRRLLAASQARIGSLQRQLKEVKDDVYARLEVVSKLVSELPAELRKEFGQLLIDAVSASEQKCAQAITTIQGILNKRIDEIDERVKKLEGRVDKIDERLKVVEGRGSQTIQVGGWFAIDKIGGVGGLRLDFVLEWDSFHFQVGGGIGASSSGLAWMADALAFAHISDLVSFGGGLLVETDASDLAETDHALLGISPALQINSDGFVFELSVPIGGLVRPGGDWEFSIGGVASAMYRF